ncbi:response regulator [Hoyosella subflava]|uniref:Transcriptional regulatory protein KdpE n=1 Tax=Hoyosella subflava (strain DSM 45089 / JCM 17490 / NBRC 109087 / DQS3-9A1) TaxID=443218 RepID=F6EL19_HOYSD|nr:response regulator [Hoyosella subflava]AEF42682.1 Phosphate regulon transcriptional regulatory protein PhoB [Hoyosella subflava DQS3-9A1]
MTTVLVVDDENQILRALRITLAAHGYTVKTAADGSAALRAVATEKPDIVVLDLGLPDIEGTDVIHGIRGWSTVPIVVLSARTDSGDKVAALDAGADDYVTKPFGMDEFLARLRSALRRAQTVESTPDTVVEADGLTIDLAARCVRRDGSDVHLTPTEWSILELLVRNRGRLVTQKQVLQAVWGPSYGTETHYLRVYLAQLRRKLEGDPSRPRYLLTEPGMGYRFAD